MTQILSVSATTAAYAMEAAKPARRVATKDMVKDVKADAEANDARAAGANPPEKSVISPPAPLKLDLSISENRENSVPMKEVRAAYHDT